MNDSFQREEKREEEDKVFIENPQPQNNGVKWNSVSYCVTNNGTWSSESQKTMTKTLRQKRAPLFLC